MTTAPKPPQPMTVATASGWRSTTGLRTALTWLFGADVLASIALLAAHLQRAAAISRYLDLSASRSDLLGTDDAVGTTSGIWLLLVLATAVVLIVWQWRSAKNNEVLGKIRPRFTPGWSIGAWFIPFANLLIPVRIFHDLWQGAAPETHNFQDWRGLRRWPVIGWWWAFYLVGGVVRITASGDTTLEQIRSADRVTALGSACTAIAAGLAIVVVRTITDRQETARSHRESIATTAPGWYADPTGRFDHRYWDGTAWTTHVSRAGQMATDSAIELR